MATVNPDSFTAEDIQFQIVHWNDDKGPLVITVTTICIVLAAVSVLLRLITRKAIIKVSWQVDDYAIFIALVLAIGLYIETLLSVHNGTGTHILRAGLKGTRKALMMTFALQLNYNICHLAIKISLLFLYRSVLTLNNPRFKLAWYAIFVYIVAFAIAATLGASLQCRPIRFEWDQVYGNITAKCVNWKAEIITMAALNTLADVALLILPMPILWNLQMALKQKISLCLIFLLGIFACVASVIRIQYVAHVDDTLDFTYIGVNVLIWSVIEPCVGISCACLSTLRPLIRVFRGKTQQSNSVGSNSTNTLRSFFKSFRAKKTSIDSNHSTRRWPSHHVGVYTGIEDSTIASSNVEMHGVGRH